MSAKYFVQRYLFGHEQWKRPSDKIELEPVSEDEAARMLGIQNETLRKKFLPTYVKLHGTEYMLYRETET